nr:hypothetical protein [Endozoicomonas sp.]
MAQQDTEPEAGEVDELILQQQLDEMPDPPDDEPLLSGDQQEPEQIRCRRSGICQDGLDETGGNEFSGIETDEIQQMLVEGLELAGAGEAMEDLAPVEAVGLAALLGGLASLFASSGGRNSQARKDLDKAVSKANPPNGHYSNDHHHSNDHHQSKTLAPLTPPGKSLSTVSDKQGTAVPKHSSIEVSTIKRMPIIPAAISMDSAVPDRLKTLSTSTSEQEIKTGAQSSPSPLLPTSVEVLSKNLTTGVSEPAVASMDSPVPTVGADTVEPTRDSSTATLAVTELLTTIDTLLPGQYGRFIERLESQVMSWITNVKNRLQEIKVNTNSRFVIEHVVSRAKQDLDKIIEHKDMALKKLKVHVQENSDIEEVEKTERLENINIVESKIDLIHANTLEVIESLKREKKNDFGNILAYQQHHGRNIRAAEEEAATSGASSIHDIGMIPYISAVLNGLGAGGIIKLMGNLGSPFSAPSLNTQQREQKPPEQIRKQPGASSENTIRTRIRYTGECSGQEACQPTSATVIYSAETPAACDRLSTTDSPGVLSDDGCQLTVHGPVSGSCW